MEEKFNEGIEQAVDESKNITDNIVLENNPQKEILKQMELPKGEKWVLQKPFITKAGNPNNILLANMGHKNNAGFIPMITIAGIIAILGAIVAYIVFAV